MKRIYVVGMPDLFPAALCRRLDDRRFPGGRIHRSFAAVREKNFYPAG